MKRLGGRKLDRGQAEPSTARIATNVPSFKFTFHTDASPSKTQQRYVSNAANEGHAPPPPTFDVSMDSSPTNRPYRFSTRPKRVRLSSPRVFNFHHGISIKLISVQNVAHMNELKAEEAAFIEILLSLHYSSQLHTACACGKPSRVRKVAAGWTNTGRCLRTGHSLERKGGVLREDRLLSRYEEPVIGLGHYGERCPDADLGRSFTLVDSNGIHATALAFCRCKTADGKRGQPEFQQLLQAGIFPGSIKDPKTGYTLGLLQYHRQQRSQGKGSAYNFALVLQRMADPFFAGAVPDIYGNFLAISRFYEYLQITIEREGFLGINCAACPERGVNMPMVVDVSRYLRHLISQNLTLDGNWKANLFFKRDDGSDTALTDGKMHFPKQKDFEEFAKTYVVPDDDKEVPCKANIGSIRHQGHAKYGNTAVSGVVACACDHTVLGSLVDMLKGEAFALGTYAQREQLRHTNSPPHDPETASPINFSYDSWCSFVVNQVKRALVLFPEEEWLHTLLACVEGQIPADHINGHGSDCKTTWQAVYFACRAHFHGETAEMIWAFLNPLGSSTRQMTGAARHDTINFVMHAWNTLKVLRAAELLAAERVDALRLFELHMAVVEDLSRQHATEVPGWSRLSRKTEKSASGKPRSVYQHEATTGLTLESVLATMIAAEQEKQRQNDGHEASTPIAQWIHDGMSIERSQCLTIALLRNHREHPLEDTWASITKLRDTLNIDLKQFRERQREIFPRLKLSALDVDEPELTAIQMPSYRMKHEQWPTAPEDANNHDSQLQEAEVKLRCTVADSGILAVRAASLALSAVKKAREQDYRGQAGITRSQRNLQKAELMKTFEITMYNNARTALIHLGHMEEDAVEPYRPLSHRDTRRKETHLHRAKGDSRLFNGTAWYLQSGVTISQAVASAISPAKEKNSDDEEPQLMARGSKRLKDITPDDVDVQSAPSSDADDPDLERSPSKRGTGKGKKDSVKKGKSKKKRDGWIWLESLMRGQGQSDEKLAAYKKESDRVQWFRAEAEMYRWLEQYERKHVELFRVIGRYRRDSVVWAGQADREEVRNGGLNGKVAYGRMQAAMHRRLEYNAKVIFKSAESGAHHDWVSATSFDELVAKIDGWRDVVFKWMDDMDIHRAYKDF
ncbi:hypothetical protein B0H13DRAFT_2368590 [Mycena leptocephala]|nr:hypothetical protein B0H13DRAFT_2368590 [Mycena leptocephala]